MCQPTRGAQVEVGAKSGEVKHPVSLFWGLEEERKHFGGEKLAKAHRRVVASEKKDMIIIF